jgi:hypothetical protein
MWKPIALVAVALLLGGCGSVGRAQRPIDEKPVWFVDTDSGASLGSVLLIPKYSASTGVSTGAGHGPGKMMNQAFLSAPVVYYSGQPLRVRQPDSHGVLLGPLLFAGRGVTPAGRSTLEPTRM